MNIINFCKDVTIKKNKSIEFQTSIWNFKNQFTFLDLNFQITWKRDHAGFMASITILNFFVSFVFYDHRHWNRKENRYCNELEQQYSKFDN